VDRVSHTINNIIYITSFILIQFKKKRWDAKALERQ